MHTAPACCPRGERLTAKWRGLCICCVGRIRTARKKHTLTCALMTAEERVEDNPVGAMRLAAWALRREAPGPINYEQGPGACAALLMGRRC